MSAFLITVIIFPSLVMGVLCPRYRGQRTGALPGLPAAGAREAGSANLREL